MYTKKHLKMKLIMNLNTECPLKKFSNQRYLRTKIIYQNH